MDRKPLKVKLIPKNAVILSGQHEFVSDKGQGASQPKMVRLPEQLHTRLIVEAGERTARTGKMVSVNEVIVSILSAYFEPLKGPRG